MTIVCVTMISCCFSQAVSGSAWRGYRLNTVTKIDTALSLVPHYTQTLRLVHAQTRGQALSPLGNKPPGSFVWKGWDHCGADHGGDGVRGSTLCTWIEKSLFLCLPRFLSLQVFVPRGLWYFGNEGAGQVNAINTGPELQVNKHQVWHMWGLGPPQFYLWQ